MECRNNKSDVTYVEANTLGVVKLLLPRCISLWCNDKSDVWLLNEIESMITQRISFHQHHSFSPIVSSFFLFPFIPLSPYFLNNTTYQPPPRRYQPSHQLPRHIRNFLKNTYLFYNIKHSQTHLNMLK